MKNEYGQLQHYHTGQQWQRMILEIFINFLLLFRKCSMCHRKKSLRTGSFLREFPRLPMGKLLLCIYFWSDCELRTTVAQMLNLTRNTDGNVYALLRHYCGRDIQDRPIVPFGCVFMWWNVTRVSSSTIVKWVSNQSMQLPRFSVDVEMNYCSGSAQPTTVEEPVY